MPHYLSLLCITEKSQRFDFVLVIFYVYHISLLTMATGWCFPYLLCTNTRVHSCGIYEISTWHELHTKATLKGSVSWVSVTTDSVERRIRVKINFSCPRNNQHSDTFAFSAPFAAFSSRLQDFFPTLFVQHHCKRTLKIGDYSSDKNKNRKLFDFACMEIGMKT